MGSQQSNSNSMPLTGGQRGNIYKSALANMFGVQSQAEWMKAHPDSTITDYTQYLQQQTKQAMPSEYVPVKNAGAAKTFNDGDYERLQADILRGNTAGLDYAKANDLRGVNNDAAKRGVWSSGLVIQSEKDLSNAYAPAYAKAGGDATAARYNLQAGDLAAINARDASNAAFDADQQKAAYDSKWRPADYLAGIWNGTGGTISSGVSGGWSI